MCIRDRGGGEGPNFCSERTVELFCVKLLFPHTPSHQSLRRQRRLRVLNLWKPVAIGAGNTALRAVANRSLAGTQLQSHFLIFLESSLVENYNTRFNKKFSQLNSDMQYYRCKDFSLKQVSGLMGVRTPWTLPLDPPLLWCPLISFLQHSVQIRTHQLLAIDARSELETQSW